jgi:ABC transporter substrate binding protein
MPDLARRELIALLGGAAAAWPVAARAQQTPKLPTIGFLGSDASAWSSWTAAFVQRLRELGWIEGRTIAIEYRWSEGLPTRNAEIAAEFVRLKVDVIVTNNFGLPTLMQATEVIPLVFPLGTDPIGGGLVASLARPGSNVTGLSMQSVDLASKRLEFLREALPQLRRLAIIGNVGNPQGVLEMGEVQAVARGLGIEVAPLEIRRAEDITPAFEALRAQADALYVVGDALVNANRTRIMTLSLSARLQRSSMPALSFKRAVSCPTAQIFRISSGARPSWSTRFCAVRSPAIFRSSSRPDSSLSSILRRPRHSACRSRMHSCCVPTR